MLDHEALGRVLGAAADASPDGLAVVDADFLVLHANAALTRLLGVGPGSLEGRSLQSFLGPAQRADEQPTGTDDVGHLLGRGQRRWHRRVLRPDGGERLADLLVTPVPAAAADGRDLFVVELVETLGALAGLATARVPLRVAQARAVEDSAAALTGAVTVADVVDVVERQVEAFEAAGLLVSLVEGPRLRLVGCRGYPGAVREQLQEQPMDGRSPMVDVVRDRSALYLETLEDYVTAYPDRAQVAGASGKRAWAFLPMVAGGQAVGSWCLSFGRPHRFTVSERALLTTLSGLLAQAVARSQLLEAERSLSRTLQRSLLPDALPVVPGCEVAVRYQAAVAGLDVGGDFYDVIPLPNGGTGIVIGDAQGHSAAAAALMGQARGALRAYAAEGHDPATIVARTNRFLVTAGVDSFVTCTYAALDAMHDGISIVRAGHPHPMLVTPDGSAGMVDVPGGLPLGIDPKAAYPVTWVPLTVGCRVVMYTDGLVENRTGDVGAGELRLLERLRGGAGLGLEAFADALLDGDELDGEDDVAVLVLERVSDRTDEDLRQQTFSAAATDATAVRTIRHAVVACSREWGFAARSDEVELLVSELVTNAVLHVGGTVAVTVTAEAGQLTVSVSDTSVHTPAPRTEDVWRTSGRGLAIVSAVADEWGVDPSGPGKSVWFSLAGSSPAG